MNDRSNRRCCTSRQFLLKLPMLHFLLTFHLHPIPSVTSLLLPANYRTYMPRVRWNYSCPPTGATSSQGSSSSRSLSLSSTTTTSDMKMSLEVEQKFVLPSDTTSSSTTTSSISSRLQTLGFVCKGTKTFTDWYFDNARIELSMKDCWLRYRVMGEVGVWQLKRGRSDGVQSTSTTVYEEIEGMEAINIAVSAIGEVITPSLGNLDPEPQSPMFDGYKIPPLPLTDKPHNLVPFCKLETVRTSWERRTKDWTDQDEYDHVIQVDLDTTNTGYAVGEVEIVVNTNEEIPNATSKVRMVIGQILQGYDVDADTPPIGKLEHFLQNHRPWHYDACLKSGVMTK